MLAEMFMSTIDRWSDPNSDLTFTLTAEVKRNSNKNSAYFKKKKNKKKQRINKSFALALWY